VQEPGAAEQLESKVIRAPRRVWLMIQTIGDAERRRDVRDQAAILLTRAAELIVLLAMQECPHCGRSLNGHAEQEQVF
jgi:hypothetical protein